MGKSLEPVGGMGVNLPFYDAHGIRLLAQQAYPFRGEFSEAIEKLCLRAERQRRSIDQLKSPNCPY